MSQPKFRLLTKCKDQPGIVASISTWLQSLNCNIIDLDQHSTSENNGTYFMRLEFQPLQAIPFTEIENTFTKIASRYAMSWSLNDGSVEKKFAILVSKHDHALLELLWLWKKQELSMEIPAIISNHPDLKPIAENFDLPFYHVPINKNDREENEEKILEILKSNADYLILARYMQILSPQFVAQFPMKIINIHHSFLPAFAGADPYRQAYDRGVKIIGATAHYVTEALDQGPIIEQDVVHVNHRHNILELRKIGRNLERQVLARAVRWQIEDRIIVDENKTVTFC